MYDPITGSFFQVFLPAVGTGIGHTGPLAEMKESLSQEVPGGTETILLVEDEELVNRNATRILRTKGYTVLPAHHAEEAIEIFLRMEGHIDLVLSDVIMPAMNGRQMVDQMRQTRPDLPVLYMSGYPADVISTHGVLEPGVAFLEKPFSAVLLASRVRQVLDSSKS